MERLPIMNLLAAWPGLLRCGVLAVLGGGVLAAWIAPPAQAQSLSISPQRIVLDGRQRSAEVLLINPGKNPETYRIYLLNKRMHEDGSLEEIKEPGPGELFASPMIRYSPRQVTVAAGQTQTVRLLVRPPRNLLPGEYMSRMAFETVPPPNPTQSVDASTLKDGAITVSITPIFAMTIPIIFRNGKLTATARFSQVTLERPAKAEEPPALAVRLEREGNRSMACDITVTYFAQSQGDGVEVGALRKVAIYASNRFRSIRLPLRIPDGVKLDKGRLIVVLRDADDPGEAVLDRRELAPP